MDQIQVTKLMTTETAHRLCNYAGKCAHIHGHSYRWEVTAMLESGSTHANGIAVDFSELKEAMHLAIYKPYDHALVLWKDDPLHADIEEDDLTNLLMAADGTPQKIVWFEHNPTAEVFALHAAYRLQGYFDGRLGEGEVKIVRVRVWETADSYGEWLNGGRFTSATNLDKNSR